MSPPYIHWWWKCLLLTFILQYIHSSIQSTNNELVSFNQTAIARCPTTQDFVDVGLVHKFKVCARPDDPIIYKWLQHDKQWGFFVEYETILAHRGPYNIIEIGGNIGINAIHSAVLGHEIMVFEPQPELARYINLNADINSVHNRVKVMEMGLSDSVGTATLLIDRNNRGGSKIIGTLETNNANYITIKIETLDTMNIDKKIFLMKIDCEGHELKVLLGGKNLLSNVNLRPDIILIEFGYKEQNPREILKMLHEIYSYEIYIVDYWLPGGQERHIQPWRRVDPSCFHKLCNDIKVYVDIAAISSTFKAEFPFLTNTMRMEGEPSLPEFSYELCQS